jgi:MoaA/NifB/PqqE/SkfB family radical SAM enzyme
MCDIWKRTDSSEMPVATLERHRESMIALKVRQVVLTGGEPLLHRNLPAVLDFFQSLNIRITLLTTGLLLSKRATLLASTVDDVILSLDGPAEIHNSIRRIPKAFETMARGVEIMRSLNASLPIAARTTVQRQNHTHLRDTVDAARALGLNSVSFLAADVSSTAFHRNQPWPEDRQQEIALNTSEVLALEDEIEALITHHAQCIDSGFISESPIKLRRISKRFRERLEDTLPRAPQCNAPWISTVMEVDGTLRPCFFHAPVATTQNATLQQAINSPAALAFRSSLDVANNPTCQRCVCSLNFNSATSSDGITARPIEAQ